MTATARVTPIRPKAEPIWLAPAEVAARVPGITVVNLQELRKKGQGPAYFKPTPKTVVYALTDVDEWVSRSRIATKDQS
ncbi:helix-turn-helix transcriptional regulator [Microbacterium sp. PA5]|uniref:helix-turn-helix transcriptional regulator n=1 Tax=Microbacterium sp. PA5 TaxID=3416654 RepID=UPI003CE6B030